MSRPSWRALVSLAGAAAGVAVAGTATTLAVRRRNAVRSWQQSGEGLALGSLRGDVHPVTTTDGLRLHVEVDEPDDDADPDAPTVVLVHGWTLTLDCWHYQRAALRGSHRVVLYDQRSHGRSPASDPARATAEQLGADLAAVLEQVVPTGPVVLVGHSMGGMTIMAYAQAFPERVRERVVGVALLGTSAGDLGTIVPGVRTATVAGIGAPLTRLAQRVPRALEAGRRLTGDLAYEATRRFAFGDHAHPEHVAFTDAMIAASRTAVFVDFWPLFVQLDMYEVLVAFEELPTVIIVGTKDALTPVRHSRRMAELLPEAELAVCVGAGHMVMLEQHRRVNDLLAELLERAAEAGAREEEAS
jgi:pimeloyl-ACP methyl ester carboxylesterase